MQGLPSENKELVAKYEETIDEIVQKMDDFAKELFAEVFPTQQDSGLVDVLVSALLLDVATKVRARIDRNY